MSAILSALREVRQTIPKRLLEQCFLSNRYYHNLSPRSVESVIEQAVIDARVRPDINIGTGTEVVIPLYGVQFQLLDVWNKIYNIPKTLTQGRSLTNVLSVGYGFEYVNAPYSYPQMGGSQIAGAANSLVNSVSAVEISSSVQAWLIGENMVCVRDTYNASPYIHLRCWIEFDKEFSTINPRSYHEFNKLVVLATKAHIYNQLVLEQDYAFIHAGQELGVLKDILNGYSEANQEYTEFLNGDWRKVAYMNDAEQMRRITGYSFPPLI